VATVQTVRLLRLSDAGMNPPPLFSFHAFPSWRGEVSALPFGARAPAFHLALNPVYLGSPRASCFNPVFRIPVCGGAPGGTALGPLSKMVRW